MINLFVGNRPQGATSRNGQHSGGHHTERDDTW